MIFFSIGRGRLAAISGLALIRIFLYGSFGSSITAFSVIHFKRKTLCQKFVLTSHFFLWCFSTSVVGPG